MTDRTGEPEEGVAGAESAEAAAPEQGTEAATEEAGSPPPAEGGSGEVQAMRERYLRLAAEYDNYRKRTEKERGESWGRAQGQVVRQLLDVIDDLQRVAHFSAESTSVQSLLEGVQMVERKLMRALEGAGLEVVDAAGQPFDPALHEALMTAPAETPEEDHTVGEVFQKGYRFKGELLRPARVQVRNYGG